MNKVNNERKDYYEYFTSEDMYLVSGESGDWVFSECDAWSFYFEMRPEEASEGGFDLPETDIIKGVNEALEGLISLAESVNSKKPTETLNNAEKN